MRKLPSSSALNELIYFSIFRGDLPQETGARIFDNIITETYPFLLRHSGIRNISFRCFSMKNLPLNNAHILHQHQVNEMHYIKWCRFGDSNR